jgi:hypothetical protein
MSWQRIYWADAGARDDQIANGRCEKGRDDQELPVIKCTLVMT